MEDEWKCCDASITDEIEKLCVHHWLGRWATKISRQSWDSMRIREEMAKESRPVVHSASQRWRVLRQLERWLETPMLLLSFVWLALALLEMTNSTSGLFQWLGTVIWI